MTRLRVYDTQKKEPRKTEQRSILKTLSHMVAITSKSSGWVLIPPVYMYGIKTSVWFTHTVLLKYFLTCFWAALLPVPYFVEVPCSLWAAEWHLLSHLRAGILQEMPTDLSDLPGPQVALAAVNTKIFFLGGLFLYFFFSCGLMEKNAFTKPLP